MYDDIPFDKETNCLLLEDAGLTGLYLMDLAALKELAKLIGREEDLPLLDGERVPGTGMEARPEVAQLFPGISEIRQTDRVRLKEKEDRV